jgi:asparagine synthase (glutamine-hydrolysing)
MCGIAGIVAPGGFDPRTLVEMTQMIDYRGPSGYGFAFASAENQLAIRHNEEQIAGIGRPVVGLGNRRLAILDTSSNGNQPMTLDDGSLCVTYNGEIYNYKEVREELQKSGHRFRTGTDTEVLLHSYQQWGEDCLQRFNGMWSFAILDRLHQKLFCARDRFGVKPFYFAVADDTFYFGSEIKQVLAASGMRREANPLVISEFLEWGLQDHLEVTSFAGVRQLLGGQLLSLDLRGPLLPKVRRYWELEVQPELRISADDAMEEFRTRFESAVSLRLRSDVPVGVSLSGGLDSSAILCEARRVSPAVQFPSFSACFEDAQLDERPFISAIAAATKSERHWTFPTSAAFWENVEAIIYHQDEPIGGTSVFAQWSVMQEARKQGIPVVLGGQGGDESLCGYRKYYFFYLWHLLRRADLAFFRESFSLMNSGTTSHWSFGTAARYLPSAIRNQGSALERLATAELHEAANGKSKIIGAGTSIAERQKTDLLITSLPKLLRHEDRNSMAHSIETRLPFLDYRLVEFLVKCPPSFKLRHGWSKWILREALEGTLPDKVRLRKSKLGFNAPEGDWLRSGLRNGHGDLWKTPNLRMEKYLNPTSLGRECRTFVESGKGAMPAETLFRAVSLELWAGVHKVN